MSKDIQHLLELQQFFEDCLEDAELTDLEIQEIQSLEIDNLHFAARIDIGRWQSEDREERRNHISFLKGKGREIVVEYFKLFLGIDEEKYLDPARHSLELVNSVKNFIADRIPEEHRRDRLVGVSSYTRFCLENDQDIDRNYIASMVSPENPQKYIEYLSEKNIEIPDSFKPTEKNIKKLMKFVIDKAHFYLSFDLQAIINGQIRPTTDGHLEILDVPDKILRQLTEGQ